MTLGVAMPIMFIINSKISLESNSTYMGTCHFMMLTLYDIDVIWYHILQMETCKSRHMERYVLYDYVNSSKKYFNFSYLKIFIEYINISPVQVGNSVCPLRVLTLFSAK